MVPSIVILILIAGVLLWIWALLGRSDPQNPRYHRICPAEDCGHVNPRRARYCARCGRKLTGADGQGDNSA